jgi:organic radical activating enzyme
MKHKLEFVQFYINNVCNLACPHCVSYNNLAFKGQFDWESNEILAKKWSEIIDPYEIAIIGGEPFTNPYLNDWVYGLKKYFNPPDFRITTNGTFLTRDVAKIKEYIDANVNIEISAHSRKHFEESINFIKTEFADWDTEIIEREPQWNHVVKRFIKEKNKGWLQVRTAYKFWNSSIKEIKNGVVYMHNNDPKLAHSDCEMTDCHYIVEGRLYKCVVTATAPMLSKQFTLDERSNEILKSTKSISPFDDSKIIDKFIKNILRPCDQCSLCPTNVLETVKEFKLPRKKIKL